MLLYALLVLVLLYICLDKKVEELRRDLRIKSQELEAKNAAANDKLKKMVKDQQEAEKKKVHRKAIAFFFIELNAVLFTIG